MKKILSPLPLIVFIAIIILFQSCSEETTQPENHAPNIESLSANPSTIATNGQTTLACVATDEDGDDLTITWQSQLGAFPNGNTDTSVSWQAPSTAGSYAIKATVSDGKLKDEDVINITVQDWLGGGTPCPGTPTINYEGKTYNTVQIGNQCWLKENLDFGTLIPVIQNQTNNSVIEKYCYNNDQNNCNIYGGLYQWNEAMQYVRTEGTKGICPDGWHIPTIAEFQTLNAAVNNDGNSLKAIGQGTGGGEGTNTSGFSALLAGGCGDGDYFYGLGYYTYFWSSSEYVNTSIAYDLLLNYRDSSSILYDNGKGYSFSVRCVKD